MKTINTTLVLAIITAVLAVVVLNQYSDANNELLQNKQDYVYTICQQAHNEVSAASEQACGLAQDKTHTEFLCNADGVKCWVEIK